MKTAAARIDPSSARPVARPDAEDSRVQMRAPLPPSNYEADELGFESYETGPDFVQFLCGRFELDRERGTALLATLLEAYVPQESYPIHTLEPRQARSAANE